MDKELPASPDAGVDASAEVGDDTDDADSTPEPIEIPEGCNPIAADWDCMLPFPSDAFLIEDGSTPSGRRVAYSPQAAPVSPEGASIDLTRLHPADGFSWASPILAVFPEGVDPAGLTPVLGDYDRSLTAASPTLLLRASDGAPVPHIAELDPRAEDDARRALVMHPVVPLDPETRYIVAIHGIQRLDGQAHPAPRGFAAVRDGTEHPVLSSLATRFDAEIFPVVESFGIPRADLQLAWDFTTGSREAATKDMLAMRTAALAAFDAESPTVTVTSVEEPEDSETLFRVIEGTIEVPLFLTDDTTSGVLNRGGDGAVAQNGTAQAAFLMVIPHSVAESESPARVLQFGHGFFGDRFEVSRNFVHEFAQRAGMVVIAVDWWGMSEPDRFPVAERIAQQPAEAALFIDRVHQAMVNQLSVPYAIRGGLAQLDEAKVEDRLVFDPSEVYFYGISQGHILGGTYLALAPDISRGALGVGGGGLSRMMFRALPFQPFLFVIGVAVPDALDQQKWAAMSQTVFDRIDPITYAPWVLRGGPEPRPEERRVLMHVGVGDASVPNLAAHFHARALGLDLVGDAARPLWGMEQLPTPHPGSGLVEFDYGVDPLPDLIADFPEQANDVHESVRRNPASMDQLDGFFAPDSAIEQVCEMACDPD